MIAFQRMKRFGATTFPPAPSAWNGVAPLPQLSSRVMTMSMLRPAATEPLFHRSNAA